MKNFFTVTFWSLINKYISLLRVQLTQKLLGASIDSDAFHMAFRMIGFFRRIFTDGSFYSFFSSYFIKKDRLENESHNLSFALGVLIIFSSIFITLSILFFLFPLFLTKIFVGSFKIPVFLKTILMWLMKPFIFLKEYFCGVSSEVVINSGAYSTEKLLLISKYAKYMFPMALSMFLCSVFSAILNSYGEFFHSSVGLVLGSSTNVILLYLGYIYYSNNLFWPFVIGTLSYTFVHALYMGIVIYIKHYKSVKPSYDKSFYKKISVTGGFQLIQNILFILMNGLFFRMKPGGYSYVEYADRLTMFVFMLIAHNLSQIITPILSKLKDIPEEYKKNCKNFFSMTMYLLILPTVFMFLYSNEIVKAIYTTNKKTNLDLLGTALKHVAISMPFWNAKRMLLTFFECKKELKQQNITGLIYSFSTFILGVIFMKYKIFSQDHLAIIWSMNLGVMIEILYLLYASHKKNIFTLDFKIILDLLLKTIVSIIIIYIINYFIISNNMWFILLKGSISLGIFAGIFYKDTINFFNIKK